MPRLVVTLVAVLLGLPVGALVLYLSAAAILGLIPLSGDAPSGSEGVDVYMRSNGIHADIIVPIQTADLDWAAILPMAAVNPVEGLTPALAFGWGDRGIFLATPTWADLRFSTALNALAGLDGTVLHVTAVPVPQTGPNTRHLRVSAERYRQLVGFIRQSFRHGEDGAPIVIPDAHYGSHDAFFEAEGRYSPFLTCNEWARRALRTAGATVPLWAPFDTALFFQLGGDPAR